jgi:pimeloyl-ACP methyl ester carboxylesterase
MNVPYDATKKSLYSPEWLPKIFERGKPYSDALICVEASRLAYIRFEDSDARRDELASSMALAGYTTTACHAHLSTQTVAAFNPDTKTALIAFRGTQADSFNDVSTDANFPLTTWPKRGRVHQGFADALLSVYPWIENWLEQTKPSRLLLTGHSLGAALATLLATLKAESELYTIGSPRVGDMDFVSLLAARKVSRFVNCADLVTRVPPTTLLGYEHLPQETYIVEQGYLHHDLEAESKRRDARDARLKYLAVQSWRLGTVAIRDLADHAPINYVSALWAAEQ